MQCSEDMNRMLGTIFLGLFFSVFVGVRSFLFLRAYKRLIEVFRAIFIGKLSVISGIFRSIAGLVSSFFWHLFVIVPIGVTAAIYMPVFVWSEKLIKSPEMGFWLLVPFLGIAMLLAFIKIRFFGKEAFKFVLIDNDKTYYRKTFSSSGSHSFGSSSFGSSSGGFSGFGGYGCGGSSGSWQLFVLHKLMYLHGVKPHL
jgi:uncharacterized protein